ncbi:MAG TPA: hypothetical protein VFO40_09010 [Chthoniobacterales bacterium]|nr:hypothetical protein [Chthoniobacterales bacterium]
MIQSSPAAVHYEQLPTPKPTNSWRHVQIDLAFLEEQLEHLPEFPLFPNTPPAIFAPLAWDGPSARTSTYLISKRTAITLLD